MIVHDNVIKEFITLIRSLVGTSLSTILVNNVSVPAVIKKGTEGKAPSAPYIVLGIESIVVRSPHTINKAVSEDDKVSFSNLKNFLISFQCYGADSFSIMQSLHDGIGFDSSRDIIRASTQGAILSVGDVLRNPLSTNSGFLESSYFSLVWGSTDVVEDPNSSIVETVTITYE